MSTSSIFLFRPPEGDEGPAEKGREGVVREGGGGGGVARK